MKSKLELRIRNIISTELNRPLKEINLSSAFVDLGADSVDTANIITSIQAELKVQIGIEELSNINNVQELIDLIEEKIQARR